MKVTDISSMVSGVRVVGTGNAKKVLLVVNEKSVKAFNSAVIEKSEVRRSKRWDPKRDIDNAVKEYVRLVENFHGKHLASIEVVASTEKPDLFRDASGKFLKI